MADDQAGTSGVACVQFNGSFKRLFSTGDTTYDLVLDYTAPEVQAHVVWYQQRLLASRTHLTDKFYTWTEQEVDFAYFQETGSVMGKSAAAGMALVSGAIALLW